MYDPCLEDDKDHVWQQRSAPVACFRCRWWHEIARQDATGKPLIHPAGECHRRAPNTSGLPKWPITNSNDYCGEAVAKE